MLALFLRFRLAFWVALGMAISFLGAIWLMPALGVSINLISLFAFILVLGIVVDDAIVVGENIHTHQHRHGEGLRGSIEGAREVSLPVVFAVLTTVAAFTPLLHVPGSMGKIMRTIPLIVIPCLLWSLVESMRSCRPTSRTIAGGSLTRVRTAGTCGVDSSHRSPGGCNASPRGSTRLLWSSPCAGAT